MPWCPKCGTEYREGFESCADCGTLLASENPHPAAPPDDSESWGPIKLVVAVFAAGISIFAACLMTVGGELWTPFPAAVAMGMLCLGGATVSIVRPMPRFGSAFIVWILAAALPVLLLLVSLTDFLIERPKFSHAQSDAETLGYLLAASAIGAVSSASTGRWLSGLGHKHALTLLATTVAFVSTPYMIYWWHSR